MRDQLPLFPLPNVVLFPDVILPLHIFEPRYRQMVEDALGSHKKIGMVLLKKGWESDYEGTPDIFEVGCLGQIVQQEKLPDGKFNILLKGVSRFGVAQIVQPKPYRQAKIKLLPDLVDDAAPDSLDRIRKNLSSAANAIPEFFMFNRMRLNRVPVDFTAPLGVIVDALSYYLAIDPYEKQPILEEIHIAKRAELLYEKMVDLLQVKKSYIESDTQQGDPNLN